MLSIRCVFVFHITCYIYDSRRSEIYKTASGSGKYIGCGLRIEIGT